MENVINVVKGSEQTLIDALQYGSTFVRFEDAEAEEKTRQMLQVLNSIDPDIVDISQAVQDVLQEAKDGREAHYVAQDVPGVFRILWKSRDRNSIILTEDDLRIDELAKRAQEEKTEIKLGINPGLVRVARKAAFDHGVKFRCDGKNLYFDAREKRLSFAKQIELAFRNGEDKIELNASEINMQTARVYASNLAVITGNRFNVTGENDKIIIRFRPMSAAEAMQKELDDLWNKAVEQIGAAAAKEVFLKRVDADGVALLELKATGEYVLPVEQIGAAAAKEEEEVMDNILHNPDSDWPEDKQEDDDF